jgi:hypothetical protein
MTRSFTWRSTEARMVVGSVVGSTVILLEPLLGSDR